MLLQSYDETINFVIKAANVFKNTAFSSKKRGGSLK